MSEEKSKLTLKDVELHTMSSIDGAYLFWYQGELFRARQPRKQVIFEKLRNLNLEEIQKLEETDILFKDKKKNSSFLPVYKHKNYIHRVRFQELPQNIQQEGIIWLIELNKKLLTHGMILKDIHESNFNQTIDGWKWLDLGGIEESNIDNIRISYLRICYLIYSYLLKTFKGEHQNFNLDALQKYSTDCFCQNWKYDFRKIDCWSMLSEQVKKIPITVPTSHWSENYSNSMPIMNPEILDLKGENIWKMINSITFNSVLDVACNKGFYTFLAGRLCSSAVGLDIEPACIQKAYQYKAEFKFPTVFGVKDLRELIASRWFEKERYSSDLVLALAIVHHIKDIISPKNFVQLLTSYAKNYVLLEDIDQRGEYEKEFLNLGWKLKERMVSTPGDRTLSLYENGNI